MFWKHKSSEKKPKKGKSVLLLPITPDSFALDENSLTGELKDHILEKGQTISVTAFDRQFLVFQINPDSSSIRVTKDTRFFILENPNEPQDELEDEISGYIQYEFSKLLEETDMKESLKDVVGTISLNSAEAYTRDVGNGVIRIDNHTMEKLNAKPGDIIEIIGNKKTCAKCLPLFPSDEDKQIARLDGLTRNNAGIGLNFPIQLRKTIAVAAQEVGVISLEYSPAIIDADYIYETLASTPIIKGDSILVPYFGGRIAFMIHSIIPRDVATLVTPDTKIQFIKKDLKNLIYLRDHLNYLRCYNNIISYDPNNVFALINKGKIYATFKKQNEAIEIFDKVLTIDSNNQESKEYKKQLEEDES